MGSSPWTNPINAKLIQFDLKAHKELLDEARRPVTSLSEEYVDKLIQQMREQQRYCHGRTLPVPAWRRSEYD